MHLGEEERRIYVSLTNQERLAGHGTSSTWTPCMGIQQSARECQ